MLASFYETPRLSLYDGHRHPAHRGVPSDPDPPSGGPRTASACPASPAASRTLPSPTEPPAASRAHRRAAAPEDGRLALHKSPLRCGVLAQRASLIVARRWPLLAAMLRDGPAAIKPKIPAESAAASLWGSRSPAHSARPTVGRQGRKAPAIRVPPFCGRCGARSRLHAVWPDEAS